jgi:diguanylate cyclase (GGDEF)-like protein
MAVAKSGARLAETGTRMSWDRARLSIVVPITVIVAVAILCIVAAVMTSARRADEVALEHEKRLLSRAIANHGERILRELESVTAIDDAVRHIRDRFDHDWVHNRIGLWLKNYFDHDFVFVADSQNHLSYALLGRNSVEPRWFNSIMPELAPTLDFVRGRNAEPNNALRVSELRRGGQSDAARPATLIQKFLGRPAAVAAVTIAPTDQIGDKAAQQPAPVVVSVKFIDDDVLSDIAARIQLQHLRAVEGPVAPPDHGYTIATPAGQAILRLAWKPKQPGAEIVTSVVPFIIVAFGGFALLAALIHGYMRRTSAAIAQGEQRLRYLALHDSLSGLPNRNYFGERLEQVIQNVRAGGRPAAVFYIDLDHFKDVNDTLGHPVGDELIRDVTTRLSGLVTADDLVGRLGGDEFAVLTGGVSDTTALQRTAERVISAICAPYAIGGHNILIGASIGIALITRKSQGGAADVMRYADMALYRAKNEGRNRACIYDAAMDADLSERKALEHDLREAIAQDDLRVVYQPIVNSSGDTIVSVEALARWTHPTRGDIEPAQFIPIAEHSGLIIELGERVLRRACTDGKIWPGLTISVNVSPLQFRRPDFVDTVERILHETDFDATCLELELTESTLLGNVESAEVAMHRLKAIGVQLALDDFGTGYSSLAYLRRFPFDKLKIDKSFVRSIERSADAAAIVHAIVGLGRGLGMRVTAEGVETAEQQLFLRAAGVHSMQGFRFGRPGSPALISTRLAMPNAHRSIARDAAALAG